MIVFMQSNIFMLQIGCHILGRVLNFGACVKFFLRKVYMLMFILERQKEEYFCGTMMKKYILFG